jgi:hypothetical protein
MNTYSGMEIKFHVFLIKKLNRDDGPDTFYSRQAPHWIEAS